MRGLADVDASNEKKKPEMILLYNVIKVDVDCFDQMARLYTRSASVRWPLAVWSNIMDIAAINCCILYKKVTRKRITPPVHTNARRKSAGKSESYPSNSNRQLRKENEEVRKRRKCHGVCCNNKTVSTCILCQKRICGKCLQDNFRVTYVKCLACVQLNYG